MEPGDEEGGGEEGRPLKKARFAWQVKGQRQRDGSNSRDAEEAGPSSSGSSASSSAEGSLAEDRFGLVLSCWQAKHLAHSMLDNSINSMLEEIHREDHVEDEAVLMAIQRHGLQPNNDDDWGAPSGNCIAMYNFGTFQMHFS
jgi:hypothetical protein